MLKFPKVSCVMATTGRLELIRKSVACFLAQTYAPRELIVLSQGDASRNKQVEDYLKSLNRDDIQFITCQPSMSLGAMRNLSIELTTGDVICQWDDDDLYHPLRIQTQLNVLLGSGIAACAYQQHLKLFEDKNELYWIDWQSMPQEFERYLCGTIMFPKSIFYQCGNLLYPDQRREEDLSVLLKIMNFGRIAPVVQGYQYIYVYHGNNTYWREHHALVLEKKVLGKSELLARRNEIEQSLRLVGLTSRTAVRSLFEDAFIYEV
jgi:glycosyltransferase involved in cell wall biosynthesis